ncbi:MAG: AsmA family protein [Flammeovirgaceae bacterium]|nr:AsmA family protein [Flammeovirgaceae bacterium]
MKKIVIIIGIVFVVLVAAAFVLPIIFKDDIKAAIDQELAKSVNADVVFDVDKFSLSLFKNFPAITAEMKDFGVINREPFANEVLFATEALEVEVNLGDVLFGDQMRLKGITLVKPIINIKVLEDGRANWDIAIPSTDTVVTAEEGSGEFSFGIDHWEIVDGEVTYDDKSIPFLAEVKGLNHTGSGDFTQSVFDLKTNTQIDTLNLGYAGDMYLSNKRLDVNATISIAEEYSKYTFKENSVKVNDFAMSFDGWFKMNPDNYGMDISFKSPDNSFKSLLSLVPGMYSESFKDIETKGDLAFNGFVKGTYSETQMPAFNVNLLVKDAMFHYPSLPTAVNNINIDLLLDNKDGVIDNTVVDLKKLHLDFGSNPVDARALITKMYPTHVDASLAAKLNLAELSKMVPMEGLEMKGTYAVNLTAKGIYDSLKKTIPSIDAAMSLANGFVKTKDFPLPLQDLKFNSTIKNTSGKMAETTIAVNDFSMVMDGEKFSANLLVQNLEDYTWDVKANGGVDLEKMTKIFPVDGMSLAGKIKADLQTKGKYSDLMAEKYEKLPTSGSASLKDFKYEAKDVPTVTISQSTMVFNPKKIELQNTLGTIGKSDFAVSGDVTNYIGYVFGKETIKGVVNFNSNLLDLNEFMTETEETTTTTDTTSYGVIPIPENIDFVLKSNIRQVKMMDFNITNATGDIIVKDGIANLNGLKFNMMGGAFAISGTYNTKDIKHPKYDLSLGIQNLSIKESAQSFSMVKTYAPVAGLVNGNFSTDFKLSGELLETMMPNLATVNGSGLVKIAQAALLGKDSKLVSGITSLTKLDNASNVSMKDVLMSASIKDGKLSVKPFDVKFGDYKTTVAGSTAIDGTIDYALKMDVPAGKLGTQFNSLVSSYTGGSSNPNSTIPVNIGLGGTFLSPSTKLLITEQKQQVKDAATSAVKQEAGQKAQELVKGTGAEKLVGNLLGNKSDTTKKDSTATKPADQIKKEGVKAIQNLLKKKKG